MSRKIAQKAKDNMAKLDQKAKNKQEDCMLHDYNELGRVQVDEHCPSKGSFNLSVAELG